MDKKLKLMSYLFFFSGICMLLGSGYWYTDIESFTLLATGEIVGREHTEATSSRSRSYDYTVEFETIDGKKLNFVFTSISHPPSYSAGEHVEVAYPPSSPEKAKLNTFFSFWGGTMALGGAGIFFVFVGSLLIIKRISNQRKMEYLKQHGVEIKAAIIGVEENAALAVNDQYPFQIIAQWEDPETSTVYTFESDNIWYDPTELITQKYLAVKIDRSNPKKYHMNISFLPESIE